MSQTIDETSRELSPYPSNYGFMYDPGYVPYFILMYTYLMHAYFGDKFGTLLSDLFYNDVKEASSVWQAALPTIFASPFLVAFAFLIIGPFFDEDATVWMMEYFATSASLVTLPVGLILSVFAIIDYPEELPRDELA